MPMKRWGLNWGLSGKRKLRKTSPFASLLIEIGAALSKEDFSAFKLAISVDKLLPRRKLSDMQNATDLLRLLWEEVLISATDTHFLEHLLEKVGRKDLEKQVVLYREKKLEYGENTPPDEATKVKTVASPSFTRLKQPSTSSLMVDVHSEQGPSAMGNIPQFVLDEGDGSLLKSEPFSFPAQPLQATQFSKYRTVPDGSSHISSQKDDSPPSQSFSPTSSLQEDGLSQMSIDGSQKSAMSISDDEKMIFKGDKIWPQDQGENCSFPF